jgi:GR25 family glycosyltransferase involved in LPS biosynthesis
MTAHPKRTEGLEIEEVDDGFMVHRSGESRTHFLNPTACLVLELCDGRQSAAQIAEVVRSAFDLQAPPQQEVEEVLAAMIEQGLVAPGRRARRFPGLKPADKLKRFPRVLWINLEREKSRRTFMETQLGRYSIRGTRISGYDGSAEDLTRHLTDPDNRCGLRDAEIGATLSHLKAIEHFLDSSDDEYAIIAEDDLDLGICRFWDFDWDYAFQHLPFDWDIVQLAIICRPEQMKPQIHLRHPQDWSAACYLISRHHAQKLVRLHCRNGRYKIDYRIAPKPFADVLVYCSGRAYSIPLFLPKLCFRSAIDQEHVEGLHTQSRTALYAWWSKHAGKIDQATLFKLR